MGTIVAPSSSSTPTVTELPGSPVAGDFIKLTGTGEVFIYQNGRWVGIEGSTYIFDYTGSVVAGKAVIVHNSVAALANAIAHSKCDGICVGLFDGKAIIRNSGLVTNLSDLSVDANYYLDIIGGGIVSPQNSGNVVLVGTAISATTLLLKLGVGVRV